MLKLGVVITLEGWAERKRSGADTLISPRI